MLDHISLSVSDADKAKKFYSRALAPLGYKLTSDDKSSFSVGADGGASIYASQGAAQKPAQHLAFRAQERKDVDAFYKAAIGAGGQDNGKPGIRMDYAPTYYAAFVRDPDGNNVEAVCHNAG